MRINLCSQDQIHKYSVLHHLALLNDHRDKRSEGQVVFAEFKDNSRELDIRGEYQTDLIARFYKQTLKS